MIAPALPSLRRYAAFITISFANHLGAKTKYIIRFISCFFFVFVLIEMWRLMGREGLIKMPFPLENILWYVALAQIMAFLSPRLFMTIDEDVRTGDIACFLTRPVPYIWMRLAEGFGAFNAQIVVYYTLGIFCTYLYIGALPTGGLPTLLAAMALVYLSSLLHLLFQVATGMTTFWIHQAEAVYRIYQKLLIVLGGMYLPLTLYPIWVQKFVWLTPFPAMLYGAIRPVLSEKFDAALFLQSFGLIALWSILALMLVQGLFSLCIRRIEVNGG
jgi:ABC-2 type transport system permease protein